MKRINIKDFAICYSKSRNAEEAAITAGVSPLKAKIEGLKLLSRKSVRRMVRTAEENNLCSDTAIKCGLERLAFGRINDAVELVFAEEITPHKIQQADLFNVSEIKKIKGGGVEIKFFDRQKAMERLTEYNEQIRNRGNAQALVEALCGDENDISIADEPLGDEADE